MKLLHLHTTYYIFIDMYAIVIRQLLFERMRDILLHAELPVYSLTQRCQASGDNCSTLSLNKLLLFFKWGYHSKIVDLAINLYLY